MKLTRTDVRSLMAIAVGGMLGLAAFGPHHMVKLVTSPQEEVATEELQPIVYVDDVRVDGMPDLDPDDIERIEVLKGTAAIELYGEDASNGVVQIFLKDATADPGR